MFRDLLDIYDSTIEFVNLETFSSNSIYQIWQKKKKKGNDIGHIFLDGFFLLSYNFFIAFSSFFFFFDSFGGKASWKSKQF